MLELRCEFQQPARLGTCLAANRLQPLRRRSALLTQRRRLQPGGPLGGFWRHRGHSALCLGNFAMKTFQPLGCAAALCLDVREASPRRLQSSRAQLAGVHCDCWQVVLLDGQAMRSQAGDVWRAAHRSSLIGAGARGELVAARCKLASELRCLRL